MSTQHSSPAFGSAQAPVAEVAKAFPSLLLMETTASNSLKASAMGLEVQLQALGLSPQRLVQDVGNVLQGHARFLEQLLASSFLEHYPHLRTPLLHQRQVVLTLANQGNADALWVQALLSDMQLFLHQPGFSSELIHLGKALCQYISNWMQLSLGLQRQTLAVDLLINLQSCQFMLLNHIGQLELQVLQKVKRFEKNPLNPLVLQLQRKGVKRRKG
jgi:hypothetical protein